MREAEEVEGLRFPLPAPLAVLGRESAEFQEARLVGMQLQGVDVADRGTCP
jgi:hypothetical protein